MTVPYPITENLKNMTDLESVDTLTATCVALVIEQNKAKPMTRRQFAAAVLRTIETALPDFAQRLDRRARARFLKKFDNQYSTLAALYSSK
ncbi:hypothetical protein [Nocardia brasiliensis]|uniref:hypothetical protein n=1 Tax=Nocardia brasiliensis TaxID=37326 RepID=UPI0024538FDC|nr:hypothetical protein [Nocardia brasiliensis]